MFFVNHGAHVKSETDKYLVSFISKAVQQGQENVVKAIVEKQGASLLSIAAEDRQIEAFNFLEKNGCNLNDGLIKAASDGLTNAVKFLDEYGLDLHYCFIKAAADGQFKAVAFLVMYGIKLNANTINMYGALLVENAIAEERYEAVNVLVKNGVEPDAVTIERFGVNLLCDVCGNGDMELVKY